MRFAASARFLLDARGLTSPGGVGGSTAMGGAGRARRREDVEDAASTADGRVHGGQSRGCGRGPGGRGPSRDRIRWQGVATKNKEFLIFERF